MFKKTIEPWVMVATFTICCLLLLCAWLRWWSVQLLPLLHDDATGGGGDRDLAFVGEQLTK